VEVKRTPLETIYDALDEMADMDPTTYDIGELAEHIWLRLWEAAEEAEAGDMHIVLFDDDGGKFGGAEYVLGPDDSVH